jgi:hypothetical protein
MRAVFAGLIIVAVIGTPQSGNAQVYSFETPPPAVTAANAPWQLSGEPVFHAGNFYYPTGPTVFFDGRVMVRVDTWFGVPLYQDSTLEPYSVIFVPVGGNQMRPYERRRDRELAGTVGSRVPSFPVERQMDSSATGTAGTGMPWGIDSLDLADQRARDLASADLRAVPTVTPANAEFVAHGVVSLQAPDASPAGNPSGLWIEFSGARWYSDGRAVTYDAGRFEPAGQYRGFPIYRELSGPADRIYVSTVAGGPLAPFQRR